MRRIIPLALCFIMLLSVVSVTAQTTTTSSAESSDLPDCGPIEEQLEQAEDFREEILNDPEATEEEISEAERDVERMEMSLKECNLRREYERTEPEGRCERIQHRIEFDENRLELIPEEDSRQREAVRESIEEDQTRLKRCRLNKEYRETMPNDSCERIQHQIEYTKKRIELLPEDEVRQREDMLQDIEENQKRLEECKSREAERKKEQGQCFKFEDKARELQEELRRLPDEESQEAQELEQEIKEAIEKHRQCMKERRNAERSGGECSQLRIRLESMMMRKARLKDDIERRGEEEDLEKNLAEMDEAIQELKKQMESCENVEIPEVGEIPKGECARMDMRVKQQKQRLERVKKDGESRDGPGSQEDRVERVKSRIAEMEFQSAWCRKEKELESEDMGRCEVMERKLEFYKEKSAQLDSEDSDRRISSLEDNLERCRAMQNALSSKCGYLNYSVSNYRKALEQDSMSSDEMEKAKNIIRQFERGLRGCKLVSGESAPAQCTGLKEELDDQSDYIERLEDRNDELRSRLEEAGEELPEKVKREDKEERGFLSRILGRIVG